MSGFELGKVPSGIEVPVLVLSQVSSWLLSWGVVLCCCVVVWCGIVWW